MTNSAELRRPRGRSPAARASVYDRLKQAIMRGEFRPGEPLVESSLAKWCEVSRTPVREALTRLEQDGLLTRSDRGLIVRANNPEDILDIYETRIVLECKVAAVAAERRTDFDLVAMRRAAERFRQADPRDPDVLAERNREFHRSIWAASHNRSLCDVLERLNMHLGRYPATTLLYADRYGRAVAEHDGLVERIEARDGGAAAALSSQHFTAARDIRIALWAAE